MNNWSYDLVFSNPDIQRRFWRAVNCPHEVGGYLFVDYAPRTFPTPFQRRRFAKAIWDENRFRALFIESFMIVPNTSDKPRTTWTAWDFQKAREVGETTADALGLDVLHFHVHPTGDNWPSQNDIAWVSHYCKPLWPGATMFAVVGLRPMTVNCYALDFGYAASPKDGTLCRGRFISWNEFRMKRFKR